MDDRTERVKGQPDNSRFVVTLATTTANCSNARAKPIPSRSSKVFSISCVMIYVCITSTQRRLHSLSPNILILHTLVLTRNANSTSRPRRCPQRSEISPNPLHIFYDRSSLHHSSMGQTHIPYTLLVPIVENQAVTPISSTVSNTAPFSTSTSWNSTHPLIFSSTCSP